MSSLKAEAYTQANEYCMKGGKQFKVTGTQESQPPYIFGNFPRVEVQFRCLSAGDPELTRPTLEPMAPKQVLETRQPASR